MEFLQGDALFIVGRAVADLDTARYGSVLPVSQSPGKAEHETRMRLEWLLSPYRDVAAAAGVMPQAQADPYRNELPAMLRRGISGRR